MKISTDVKIKFYMMKLSLGLFHGEAMRKTLEWVRWLEET